MPQKKVHTYTTWLGDEVRTALKPLKSFVSLVEQFDSKQLDANMIGKISQVLESLCENTENRVDEILQFTEKKLGHIRLIAARSGHPDLREGKLLDAELIAEYDDESAESADLPQIVDFKDNEL
jgi:hypothetical protein